ncbi:MAG: fused MFS/spermidine synthase [Candidatus Eisenbacteria bacterium]
MSKAGDNHGRPVTINLVVFLAGFSFLLYEVGWNRLLSLVLGSTVTASTIVLASFMAGFGGGAWLWGRAVHRTARPARLLALLLAGTGFLGALASILVTGVLPVLYGALAPGLPPPAIEAIVFLLAAALLFLPALFMGGMFPVASAISIGGGGSIPAGLGRLYALETLGSAAGGLAAGFLLLGTLGLRNTMALAVAVDLALGLLLATRPGRAVPESARSAPPVEKTEAGRAPGIREPGGSVSRSIAFTGTFACGLALLALQVLWMRVFRVYLTNTSYTFALVSSLVVLGLFTGSAFFRCRGPAIEDHPASMLRVLVLLGASTAAGLLLLVDLPRLILFPFQAPLSDPMVRTFLLPLVVSLIVVFPPALFSGYAFPLACRMASEDRRRIGEDVGRVLTVNTIGAVIGPVLAAFVLLPLLGAARSVLAVLLLLTVAAVFILRLGNSRRSPVLRAAGYGVATLLVALILFLPPVRILPPSFSRFGYEVLFYRESVEGTLSVGRERGRGGTKQTYVNNSAVIGSSYDAVKVVKMVGHLPFFLGLECRDALVIGFGIGVTTSAIASHPEVESIECVELVPGLLDAAFHYRDLNRGVEDDPRLALIPGDGRHYLRRTEKTYDLISCDPTHPILGSGNLYTKEYFALCKARLNPGGMVSQYLPLHKLRTEDFLGLIATFRSEFPNCAVWLGHYHAVLLGSRGPVSIPFDEWSANVSAVGPDPHFYADPYHLAATLMLDGETIRELGTGSGINSDDRSYTEFFDAACLNEENIGRNLSFLMENRGDVDRVFRDIGDPERMARFVRGNRLLTESLRHRLAGDHPRGLEALREACLANPEDREFPFLIELYY